MKRYLILAAADVSKAQQVTQSTSNPAAPNPQHRNIPIDSDEPTDTRNIPKSGCMKFILKEIFPNASEELITAFEYEGRIWKQGSIDPKAFVGKVLEVNASESCRGILLLQCEQCKIVGMEGMASNQDGIDDLFDDDDLLDLSFI